MQAQQLFRASSSGKNDREEPDDENGVETLKWQQRQEGKSARHGH